MPSPYADYSKEELLDVLTEYERMISWDVDCVSCANMLDRIYDLDCVIQEVHDILGGIPVATRKLPELNHALGNIYSLVEPHVWGK